MCSVQQYTDFHTGQQKIGLLNSQRPKLFRREPAVGEVAKKNSLLAGRNLKQSLGGRLSAVHLLVTEKESSRRKHSRATSTQETEQLGGRHEWDHL